MGGWGRGGGRGEGEKGRGRRGFLGGEAGEKGDGEGSVYYEKKMERERFRLCYREGAERDAIDETRRDEMIRLDGRRGYR